MSDPGVTRGRDEGVEVLLEILRAHPEGMGRSELLAALRARWPGLSEHRAGQIIVDAGPTVRTDGPRAFAVERPDDATPSARSGRRVVVFDCETSVRLIAEKPYTDARLYQIAGRRMGTDAAWIAAAPTFDRFVELPEGFEIYSAEVRRRHEEAAVDPVTALGDFTAFVDGAEFLVAYNGESADYEYIDRAASLADVEPIEGPARADAFYLALCLYPHAPRHSLFPLAEHLGVDLSDLAWHGAADDSIALSRLLERMAADLAAMDPGRRGVLGALCADSPHWRLLFALAELDQPAPGVLGDAAIEATVAAALAPSTPMRARGRGGFGVIPASLKGPDGVDPHRLASVVRGSHAEVRPAQDQMAQVLRGWAAARTDGLCEAPTGIGKSFVTISTALDWLERHPSGRVVIATHTKQLQRQLMGDLERLGTGDLGWLRTTAGLVKGARNRLSLRALVQGIDDAQRALAAPRPGRRRSVWANLRLRELLAYVYLRLCAPAATILEEAEARSVDKMDVPAFFDAYCAGRLSGWLRLISQDETGDYRSPPPPAPSPAAAPGSAPGAPSPAAQPGSAPTTQHVSTPGADPLALHTELVAEAVGRHRLVVTNHALLMAHLEHIADPDTLLIVDEAHAVEGAATEALSAQIEYESFEGLVADASRLARELGRVPVVNTASLATTAEEMENTLASGLLPNQMSRVFDRLVGPPPEEHMMRSAALASSYTGEGARTQIQSALRELITLGRSAAHIGRTLRAMAGAGATAALTREQAQRFFALLDHADAVSAPCADIENAVRAIWPPAPPGAPGAPAPGNPAPPAGPAPGGPAPTGAAPPPTGGEPGTEADGASAEGDAADPSETDPSETDPSEDLEGPETTEPVDAESETADFGADLAGGDPSGPGPGGGADGGSGGALPPVPPLTPVQLALLAPPPSNAVVWAEEQPGYDPALGGRTYRFAVNASPIELGADGAWRSLRPSFAASIWISATLSVANRFDFIRSRLGFGPDVEECRLPESFDYADAARLYVLADFPSWAEHEKLASRTMAHQVAGFVAATTRPGTRPPGLGPNDPTPLRAGAMVITTSTAAAAGAADRIGADLAAAEVHVPIHAAPLRGNARAVRDFEEMGGVLVGTKGLWAGVNIESDERVRLLWVNKLPFAPFADPLVEARRAAIVARALADGHPDPERVAQRDYYLPIAALELRQGVGRLIRSAGHRGAIIISDRRLAGEDHLRRMYRDVFLGSLDPNLAMGTDFSGNVVDSATAWRGVWDFMADLGEISTEEAEALTTDEALERQVLPPEIRAVFGLRLSTEEVTELKAEGEAVYLDEVAERCATAARHLEDNPTWTLKDHQREAIDAVASGGDLFALLPTGYGKSACFQLPALVLPGVTVVISPLVALMADQAMSLNRSIGGAVRALVAPLRDSSSRSGKAEVTAALAGTATPGHGAEIKLVYVSPERVSQRAFREALYAGAASGNLARIAIDEAHTLVQWGEDFRPAFRRLTPVLDDLRKIAAEHGHPLSISALTATANATVRAGLLESVFGVAPEQIDVHGHLIGEVGPRVVEANPIRPELAIYTRDLGTRGGEVAISGIAEAVANAADGHLIIYCLTINETQAVYAQLCSWAGATEADWVIRRFHGQLPEAEKAMTLNAFKEAPYPGEEGYRRMIVVATSAFGLGIDRRDIAAVLSLSPPSDLSALYQQLGRAGRALAQLPAGAVAEGPGPTSAIGMALAHRRGWRMVEFLTTRELPLAVMQDLGARVITCGGLLDATEVASDAIAAAEASGALAQGAGRSARVRGEYRAGVVRALATLAALGAVDDHGDIPFRVKVTPGYCEAEEAAERAFVDATLAAAGDPTLRVRSTLDLPELHATLAAAGLTEAGDGPAETWVRLLDAHGAGWIDVSQYADDQRFVSALVINTNQLPPSFDAGVSGRAIRAMAEITILRNWFNSQVACAQEGFADYYGAGLPEHTCTTAANQCSRCWLGAAGMAVEGDQPALFGAFMHHNPAPASPAEDAARTLRLRQDIVSVLRLRRLFYRGVTTGQLEALFTGNDSVWSSRNRRSYRVPRWIPSHERFGSARGWLRRPKLLEVLDELEQANLATKDGIYWRFTPYVVAAAARAAANAAAANPAQGPGGGQAP